MKSVSSSHCSDGGFVMIWVAICMLALLGFAGLGVDVAAWHLQASKLQRASDAAALVGVTLLPDETAARNAVIDTLHKNGVDPSSTVSVVVTPLSSKKLSVSVTNSHVKTAFASFLVDHISLTRRSTAEFRNTIKMGNPFSQLGGGFYNEGQYQDVRMDGYWLAINGYCTAAEDGDMYASRYDGNKGDGVTNTSVCDGSRGRLNPSYKPITAKTGGYDYIIDMPSGAPQAEIQIHDPAFTAGIYNTSMGSYSHDVSLAQPGDPVPSMRTTYKLFSTPSDTPANPDDDTLLEQRTFETGELPLQNFTFADRAKANNSYRINVTSPDDSLHRSYGVNTYSIELRLKDWVKWNVALPNTRFEICDFRLEVRCPHVAAIDALSVQVIGGDNTASLFLASLDASYAGDNVQVGLFDPGEGAKSMRLMRPDQYCSPFLWSTPPKLGVSGMSGAATGENCTLASSALDVSGTSPRIPDTQSAARFNDRLVTLDVRLPINYGSVTSAANNTTWWKVQYQSMSGGTNPNDRTTWMMTLADGGPIRLVPNS